MDSNQVDWGIWARIESGVHKYCRRKWNGNGKDILSETKIIMAEKMIAAKFVYHNDEDAEKYAKSIAKRCARDVVGYITCKCEISLEDIAETMINRPPNAEEDERIRIILSVGPPKVKKVMELVYSGENIRDACKAAKISYPKFIRGARNSYYQMSLLFRKNDK